MRVFLVSFLITLLVIAAMAGIGIGCSYLGETIGYGGGYCDGHDDGYSQGYTVGQGESWEQGYNVGWNDGQAEPLRLFGSLRELWDWLSQDDTDSFIYVIDIFDCDDFAIRLSQNAANDGYFIGLYRDREAWHFQNYAFIEGETAAIYLIEPQTDLVEFLWVD